VLRPLCAAAAAAVLAALAGAAAVPAAAAELRGRVEVVDARGRPLPGAASQAVVWFVSDREVRPEAPVERDMVTLRKQFEPRTLVVPVGSTVRFPNRDPILHNVFSISGGNGFDLGFLPKGKGGSHRFTEAGVVRVFCNVHHSMVGYVVVVDTPFHAVPGPDGELLLSGLPAAPGTLTAWHERGEVATLRVDPSQGGSVVLRVVADRPLVPPHLNKLGRPYARSRRDRY